METTTISVPPQQPIAAMEVGTWVRTKDIGTAAYNSKIGKIMNRLSGDDHRVWVLFQNQDYDASDRELILKVSDLEVLEDQENAQQHQTLEAWQSRYKATKERIDHLNTQFDYLCEVITETAEEAGYCDEYDKVVEEVNSRMRAKNYSMALTRREREYEVEVSFSATVHINTVVMVTAASEDEACDYVQDNPSDFMSINELIENEIVYNEPDFDNLETDVR
jgi:hypothetical protein